MHFDIRMFDGLMCCSLIQLQKCIVDLKDKFCDWYDAIMRLFGHEIWMKFNAWPTKRAEYSILPLFFKRSRADLQVMDFDCSLLNLNAPCHLFMHQLVIANGCIYIPNGIRLQSSLSHSNRNVTQKLMSPCLFMAMAC